MADIDRPGVRMNARRILVIEDEAPIRRGVVAGLRACGHTVTEAITAPEGEERRYMAITTWYYSMFAYQAGTALVFSMLSELQADSSCHRVLFVADRTACRTDNGADDVVKPQLGELRARIDAVLRRSASDLAAKPHAKLSVDLGAQFSWRTTLV